MKKIVLISFLFMAFYSLKAQILEPVKWKSKTEKISATEFKLIFEGTIENEWHVYSQFTPDGGPLPMILTFNNQKNNYQLIGKTVESKTKKQFNDVFGVDEILFEKKVVLTQKVKIINPNFNKIDAVLEYQVCKDACINDKKKFSFNIPKAVGNEPETIQKEQIIVANSTEFSTEKVNENATEVKKSEIIAPAQNKNNEEKGLWVIFFGTILAGLLATITPCVFPMIPMTVSFFLKQSSSQSKGKFNAFFYGFCIIGIYVLISIPFHLFESLNPDMFSEISTNPYLNIFFFIVFVVFAISFFGAFEITMPNKFANKVDNASNAGGLLGIFFMALTLIIVSFSCTGPALGLVLGSVLSTDGGATILSIAMLGFGIGLALPFISLALFPSLMKSLPKSGGWLNTVKVVFGFIELALALKFLSNADIGLDLHLLEREQFLSIWISIFGLLSFYFFGKINLPHDSLSSHISVGRMLLGLISLSFTMYLIPGLWGAPLKMISAFPPPMSYSESPYGVDDVDRKIELSNTSQILPKGAIFGSHNIITFEDYNLGLEYAKKVNKPILIDFTGKQCQNCRLMENNVWSDEKVLNILKNEIVLISLYGDDKKELPKNEKYISSDTGNEINTIGEKWSEFQRQKFKSNARPYYVLVNVKEEKLNEPVPYTPNVEKYFNWLTKGIANFKK
ncbi:MAG: thioredoxin family protein [Flavobacterium sp.]|nr:thioredoxin family protein [Flavobacterium sp.]